MDDSYGSSSPASDEEEKEEGCFVCNDLNFNKHPWSINNEWPFSEWEDSRELCRYCDLVVRAVKAIFPHFLTSPGELWIEASGCLEDTVQICVQHDPHNSDNLDGVYLYEEGLYLYPPRDHNQNTSDMLDVDYQTAYFSGIRRTISPHSDSEECLQTIWKWDRECQYRHQYCKVRQAARLPTRVICVGSDEPWNPLRLAETNGEWGYYIALSHCWGQQAFLKTGRATLQDRTKGICWDDLAPNFQDVITVARKLAIEYVWIDALCIIQDDRSDWEIEAAKMKDVYTNAYLTIAAANASNNAQGFLKPRPNKTITLEFPDHEHAPDGIVLARRDLHAHSDRSPFQNSPAPLFERGWIYQERLLSARVLYFEENELLWDCRTDVFCECGDFPSTVIHQADYYHIIHNLYMLCQAREDGFNEVEHKHCELSFDNNDSGVYDWWYTKAMIEYTRLKFTKESDRLPALSGLAKLMVQKTGDVYLAGLWKRDLVKGLLWHSVQKDNCCKSYLPRQYRAPSWSWMSIESPNMDFIYPDKFPVDHSPYFSADSVVVEAYIVPLGEDVLSEVVDGRITLFGSMLPAMLRMQAGSDPSEKQFDFSLQVHSTEGAPWLPFHSSPLVFHPDVNITLTTIYTAEQRGLQVFQRSTTRPELVQEQEKGMDVQAPVHLLRLGRISRPKDGVAFLVLTPSMRENNAWERIGLLIWWSDRASYPANPELDAEARIHEISCERQEVTIL